MQPHVRNPFKSPAWSGETRLYQLYEKGPCDWNTRPYTMCIECYRTQRHPRRHLAPKADTPPSDPGQQTLEVTSYKNPQLSSVTTNQGPVLRRRPDKCNMPFCEVHTNTTVQSSYYVFEDGQ